MQFWIILNFSRQKSEKICRFGNCSKCFEKKDLLDSRKAFSQNCWKICATFPTKCCGQPEKFNKKIYETFVVPQIDSLDTQKAVLTKLLQVLCRNSKNSLADNPIKTDFFLKNLIFVFKLFLWARREHSRQGCIFFAKMNKTFLKERKRLKIK